MYAIYQSFSEPSRTMIDGLKVVHSATRIFCSVYQA
jgi:hypothetical protein